MVREVVREIKVEPQLLPFENEDLRGKTESRSTEARLDIHARGFWTRQQDAFFDVQVTHPKANVLTVKEVQRQLEKNEQEKKRSF